MTTFGYKCLRKQVRSMPPLRTKHKLEISSSKLCVFARDVTQNALSLFPLLFRTSLSGSCALIIPWLILTPTIEGNSFCSHCLRFAKDGCYTLQPLPVVPVRSVPPGSPPWCSLQLLVVCPAGSEALCGSFYCFGMGAGSNFSATFSTP